MSSGWNGAYPTACLACCKMCVKVFFFERVGGGYSANPFAADCK